MEEGKNILAIDGGGTKTQIVVCSATGRVLYYNKLSASNPVDIGMDNTLKLLDNEILSIKDKYNISIAFFGIAGGITGNNKNILNNFFNGRYDFPIMIDSDVVNAINSCLKYDDGITVIAGTGSICFIRQNDKLIRLGGWGYLFDDGGSGYNIGRDCIKYSLMSLDGRGEKTILSELLYNKIGNIIDHVSNFYKGGKRYIAQFAPIVFEAYEINDNIAIKIINDNCKYIADMINYAVEKSGLQNVWLIGGLMHQEKIMMQNIKKYIKSQCELNIGVDPPILGAVIQAKQQLNEKINDEFIMTFRETLQSEISRR